MSNRSQPRLWLRATAIGIFLGISLLLVLLRDHLTDLGKLGYGGAFLVSLASSASIVLPVPGVAVTFALGGTLPSALLVGLAAGAGETLGELTGYLAGYGGRVIIEDRQRYRRLSASMQRYGAVFVFLLAAIPNPAFDLAGIAAGALRFPVGSFLLACWPGKTLKTTVIAFAGAGLLPWVTAWVVRIVS